ncbi:MAG: ribonuclease D [Micavibrio sp.]|nr:MAG: ribonuclease D [Micavibrio sp.]
MKIELHHNDLPDGLDLGDCVAVDCEMMGLKPLRDRLCMVQLSAGDGVCHLVKFGQGELHAPNLSALLEDEEVTKIFHFARGDLAVLLAHLDAVTVPVYCTKIASKLVRTFTPHHNLKTLCKDLLDVDMSKQQTCSDWGAEELSPEQLEYAALDVLYLHEIKAALDVMLEREGRMQLAQSCFDFLPTRAFLDLCGWQEEDIFEH